MQTMQAPAKLNFYQVESLSNEGMRHDFVVVATCLQEAKILAERICVAHGRRLENVKLHKHLGKGKRESVRVIRGLI